MDHLLSTLGVLFALFLVLAAAVEAVLEIFRGLLERLGLGWLRGKTSLDEALRLASEFAPTNPSLNHKLAAVALAAGQIRDVADAKRAQFGELRRSITEATSPALADAVSTALNQAASEVKSALEAHERSRVFVLKLLSVAIGIGFAYATDFHVFRILAASPEAAFLARGLAGLQGEALNCIVGGIAAAAGSNYWHDQLDRVRAVKASVAAARSMAAPG
jgi:hypothetical protein